jgi:hypothetical protein
MLSQWSRSGSQWSLGGVFRPVVGDSYHFDEESEGSDPDRHKNKKIKKSIPVPLPHQNEKPDPDLQHCG